MSEHHEELDDVSGEPAEQEPSTWRLRTSVGFGMGVAALAGLAVMASAGGYDSALISPGVFDSTCCIWDPS